ncbi:MAG: hypothetical protein ABIF04_06360 [Chloroflexota bacterium]
MLAPVTHFLPYTTIRRERLLPLPGRILVREQQKVNSLDVVAEAHFGKEHLLIDVAGALGVRADAAQKLIQVKAGGLISQGDEIARRKGLVPRVVRAPRSGQVLLIGAGQVFMEVGETAFELQAGIPGTVTRLIPDRGVEITFNGALVQGIWGNGQMNAGLLMPMLSSPEESLVATQLDISLRGAVLLAGNCNDPTVLQAADELPVRGIIFGSMAPALVPQALQVNYPIIVVDGFGQRPLNSAAYKLLTEKAKFETTLNAMPLDRQTGVGPEIFIPLPVTQESQILSDAEVFALEQTVRLRRNPHAGAIGTIISLRPRPTIMPSGIRANAAEVRLDSGEQVLVPLANLEVLG